MSYAYRVAMPQPAPEGLRFKFHHSDDSIPMPGDGEHDFPATNFMAPAVAAYVGDNPIPVGYVEWHTAQEGIDLPQGEVSYIWVHPELRRHSIGSEMFEWTKANVEPELHHSETLSSDGRQWVPYQQSRQVAAATQADAYDELPYFNGADEMTQRDWAPPDKPKSIFENTTGKWYHASPHKLPVGTVLTPHGGDPTWGGYDRKLPAGRQNWVWIDTDEGVQDWWHGLGEETGNAPYLYEVEPHEGPYPWNGTGHQGHVAPAATITREVRIHQFPDGIGMIAWPQDHEWYQPQDYWDRLDGIHPLKHEDGEELPDEEDELIKTAMPQPTPDNLQFTPFEPGSSLAMETSQASGYDPQYQGLRPGVAVHLDDKLIGHVEWQPASRTNANEVAMIRIYDPAHRRHGIATALFDEAKRHNPDIHHSELKTDLGTLWVNHERYRSKVAMPLPAPEGLRFVHHDADHTIPPYSTDHRDLTKSWFVPIHSYEKPRAPMVTAHIGDDPKPVGFLRWEPHNGEVGFIWVSPIHRRKSVASEMFDHAKTIDDRVHHSAIRTNAGDKWFEYEMSRHKHAMPAAPPEGLHFRHDPNYVHPTSPYIGRVEAYVKDTKIGHIEWLKDDNPLSMVTERKPGEITYVWVDPLYRRRNVATQMLDWTRENARPDIHHSRTRTNLGDSWVYHEQNRKVAMPMPTPELTFVHHDDESGRPTSGFASSSFDAPAVSAHLPDGTLAGYVEWFPDDPGHWRNNMAANDRYKYKPGEVSYIWVDHSQRRHGIATAIFDWAKANARPDLHHSPQLTDMGKLWVPYEQGRNRAAAIYTDDEGVTRGGNCYEAAGRYLMDNDAFADPDSKLRLVHGEVAGQGPLDGRTFGHAWIEDGDTVIDQSNGRDVRMPKQVYYLLGKIDRLNNIHVYTPREAADRMLEHKHFGPWELQGKHPAYIESSLRTSSYDDGPYWAAAWDDEDDDDEEDKDPRHKTAMPAPTPEGITFHYHPTDDTIRKPLPSSFYAPGLEARLNGVTVGLLNWTDGSEEDGGRPVGEINNIRVHSDYQRHGVATAMFDHVRQHHEPEIHHSGQLSELGRKWRDHEQSRHKTAMPAPLPRGITFKHMPDESELGIYGTGTIAAYHPDQKESYAGETGLVGFINYEPDGEISFIHVHHDWRRRNIATSMFDYAKQVIPDLHHSDDLTQLGKQWVDHEQSRLVKGAILRRSAYEHGVYTRPQQPSMDKLMAGTLRRHKYPDEIDFPIYHGSSGTFAPGDLIEPGRPGNFVRRMKHVYVADAPEKSHQYGGTVYEVRPTGPIGHRRDARPEQGYYASEWPYEVVRAVPVEEYAEALKKFREAGAVRSVYHFGTDKSAVERLANGLDKYVRRGLAIAQRKMTDEEREHYNSRGWHGEPCEDPDHHGRIGDRCADCGSIVAPEYAIQRQAETFAYRMEDDPSGVPPGPDTGHPMHAVDAPGFYDPPEPEREEAYPGQYNRDVQTALQAARGNPEALVTVYRAVPPNVRDFNRGDWVSPSRNYVIQHQLLGGWPIKTIIRTTVPARSLYTYGYTPLEWGYHGESVQGEPPTPEEWREFREIPNDDPLYDLTEAQRRGLERQRTAMPYADPANAQRTQISGTDPTYVRGHVLLDAIGAPQGETLDYGAGLCRSPELAHPVTGEPLNMVTYEPFARDAVTPHFRSPEELDRHVMENGGFNRLMALNVINTIEPGDDPMRRNSTVRHIGSLLAPGGHALITTRGSDVLTTGGTPVPDTDPEYEPMAMRNIDAKGFKWYQKGFRPQELSDYVQSVLGEGYSVRPVPHGEWRKHTGKGGPPAGIIIVRNH